MKTPPRFHAPSPAPPGTEAASVEAEDCLLGRPVRLKVLAASAGDAGRRRFRREARAAARLEHPNILAVHDAGVLPDGSAYVATRRPPGRTLEAVLSAADWSWRRRIEAFRDVCRAVAFAHRNGSAHGALDAGRIYVGEFGETLVDGWGEAKRAARGADLEALGGLLERLLAAPAPGCELPPPEFADARRRFRPRERGRFAGAAEALAEMESILEGRREQERRLAEAEEHTGGARGLADRWRALAAEAERVSEEAAEASRRTPPHLGAGALRAVWQLEDRAWSLRREALEALSGAEARIASALQSVPGHAAARTLRAEIHLARLLECERLGRTAEALVCRSVVEQDGGQAFADALRGDGSLAVATVAYPCDCLTAGREVSPAELNVRGYHPLSGRRLDGVENPASAELEPRGPVCLRVHAAGCRAEPAPGAEVWAFRYQEVRRQMIPRTPGTSDRPVPASVLDALFGDSPCRPQGGGLFLGRTPVTRRPWPRGAWLLVVAAPDRAPLRVSIHVDRAQDVSLDLTLFRPSEIPPDFVTVSAGPFPYQRAVEVSEDPGHIVTLDDFFLARFPVTCARYAEYLEALHSESPQAAIARAPKNLAKTPLWTREAGGRWRFTTPLDGTTAAWEEDWPVLGVTWRDALAYAAWETSRAGRLLTIPDEAAWEKGARGADGRRYPWGNQAVVPYANSSQTNSDGRRPVGVHSFPADESPWGARGLGGNSRAACLNDAGPEWPGWKISRGGSWSAVAEVAFSGYRTGGMGEEPGEDRGIRLHAPARLSPTDAKPGEVWPDLRDAGGRR